MQQSSSQQSYHKDNCKFLLKPFSSHIIKEPLFPSSYHFYTTYWLVDNSFLPIMGIDTKWTPLLAYQPAVRDVI